MALERLDELSRRRLSFMDRLSLEKAERDRISRMATAKAEGKAEGKAETSHEIAAKMLRKGCTSSFISEVTGLTKAEISRLKNGK